MAIIWADFPSGQQGIYGTSTANMLLGIWAEVSSSGSGGSVTIASDPDPNIASNGKVLTFYGAIPGLTLARIVLPAGATSTVGAGYRLWQSQLPNGNGSFGNAIFWFQTAANATICYIKALADGSLGAYNSADALLGQSAPCLTAAAYNHIEMKVLRHASTGTIEVRVNGAVVLNLSNLALGSNDIGMVQFGSFARTSGVPTPTNYYKDFVLWDGTGSEGNDFQGSVAVHDLYPNADISLNWTPSTGSTGWDLIDETTPNDADYIGAPDPAPAAYVASLTDLPEDVTSVRALLPIYRAQKTDGGDCNIQVGVTPNNTNWDDGADRPMTTAYTYWWDVSHLSPATAAPWTPVEVNAAYVRADRTL